MVSKDTFPWPFPLGVSIPPDVLLVVMFFVELVCVLNRADIMGPLRGDTTTITSIAFMLLTGCQKNRLCDQRVEIFSPTDLSIQEGGGARSSMVSDAYRLLLPV